MGVYVYKSKHINAIKIGHHYTNNAWGRVIYRGFYSCICPNEIKDRVSAEDLILLCWYPTLTIKDEKKLHNELIGYKMCGEWFTSDAINKILIIVKEENKVLYCSKKEAIKSNVLKKLTLNDIYYYKTMNKLDYYTRQKDTWDNNELEQLRKEYEDTTMTVSQIADIHLRTPGSISYKLKSPLKLITHNALARGYKEYQESDLYKEILAKATGSPRLANNIVNSNRRKSNNEALIEENGCRILEENQILVNPQPTDKQTAKLQRKQIPSDIIQLKKDVADLKNDVKEILRLMNALYDFESQ